MYRMNRKRKWVAVLLLVVLLILTASSLALADQPSPLLNNPKIQQYDNNQLNQPSYGEKFIAGIINGGTKWLMNALYIDDPTILVFNKDPRTDKSNHFLADGLYGSLLNTPNQLVLGIFPIYFFKAIAILYDGFTKLLPIPLVLIMVVMGILFMMNSGTTEGRIKLKDYTQAFVTAIVTLRFGAYIWTAIISLTQFIVKLIWAYMIQSGVKPGFFMDMIWGGGTAAFNSAVQIGSLPLAVLLFMAALMVLTLNYQYIMRMITLGMLILAFPIVTTASTYPAYRHSLQTWMQEFVANVVLQLGHALALGTFFILLNMPGIGPGGSFWLMLAYFAGLPAMAGLIRELLRLPGGIRSGAMGAVAGMAGIATLGSIGRMVTRHQGDQGVQSIDTGNGAVSNDSMNHGPTGGGNTMKLRPKLAGATSFVGKGLQGGYNGASSFLGNKYVQGGLKTTGRGSLGVTAAAAGAVLSTMTTGSAAPGLMMGASAGSAINRVTGQVLGGAGREVQTVAQSISSSHGIKPKDIGSNLMAQSIQKGGILAGANWGLQAAANKVSEIRGREEKFVTPSFVKENKSIIRSAQTGMVDLQPRLDMAQANYEHAKVHHDKESDEYKNAFSHYNSLKDLKAMYQSESLLAQTRLKSPGELQRYKAAFSASRGKLD